MPAGDIGTGAATFRVHSADNKADGEPVMLGDTIQLENLYADAGATSRWLEIYGGSIQAGGLSASSSLPCAIELPAPLFGA